MRVRRAGPFASRGQLGPGGELVEVGDGIDRCPGAVPVEARADAQEVALRAEGSLVAARVEEEALPATAQRAERETSVALQERTDGPDASAHDLDLHTAHPDMEGLDRGGPDGDRDRDATGQVAKAMYAPCAAG